MINLAQIPQGTFERIFELDSDRKMNHPTNCPNCGAPMTGCKCEYCGTVDHERMKAVVFKNAEKEAKCCADRVREIRESGMIPLYEGEEVTVI